MTLKVYVVFIAKTHHQLRKDVPQQNKVPYHLPPSTPLFMGDSGWKVYNRTSFFAQNAPSFRVKQIRGVNHFVCKL